jgi:ribonuclease M5
MLGFIVEGFHDESTVKRVVPSAYFVVTNGTRMNNRVRMDVNKALEVCTEIFILTDPDEAGDILTEMLLKYYPSLQRIFLDRDHCKCYRRDRLKIGVEHCSDEYLTTVLSKYIILSKVGA